MLLVRMVGLGGICALGSAQAKPVSSQGPFRDVREYGAAVDGQSSDTAALQRAFDEAPIGSTVHIPAGVLRVGRDVHPDKSYCVIQRRLVHLWCEGTIRADLNANDKEIDLLRVSVAHAGGYGDVRNHTLRMRSTLNGGGRSSVRVEPALPVIRMKIIDGSLHGLSGPAVFCGGDMNGTIVAGNQIDGGLEFGEVSGTFHADNTIVRENTIFGTRTGVVLDMIQGSFTHLIQGNVIVCRDGAIHVRNGAQVKIRDNQFEQFQRYGRNTHWSQSTLVLEGSRFATESCDITGNNFGGGDNVLTNIYIANANKTLVDANDFHWSVNNDILMTARSRNTQIGRGNRYRGAKRSGIGFFGLKYSDTGVGNTGMLRPLIDLLNESGWSSPEGYIVVIDGVAHLDGSITGGQVAPGSVIGTLPPGYRPRIATRMVVHTPRGPGAIEILANGSVRVVQVSIADIALGNLSFAVSGDLQ